MELTIVFDVCAFLLCAFCVLHELRRKRVRNRQNITYLLLTGNIMGSAVFAVIANTIQQEERLKVSENRTLLFAALMGYFLVHNVLPATYALYMRIVIGLDANTTPGKELRFFAPAIVAVIIVWLNIPFGFVFSVTKDMRFEREYMEYVLYAISTFYLVSAFYYLARYHVALLKKTMRALYAYYAMTIFGVIFQLAFSGIKVELFFESLGVLGLLLTFEEHSCNS